MAIQTARALTMFEQLVKEAVETELELRTMQTPQGRKLTAEAFVREALKNAGGAERVASLLQAIDANPAGFPETARFMSRARQAIKASTMPEPPPNASHAFLRVLGANECQGELATAGASIMAALALAAQDAVRLFPEAFGTASDLRAHRAKFEQFQARKDVLLRRIRREWTNDDVTLSPPRSDGSTVVAFKITDGAVKAGLNFPEELINYCCGSREALQRLGVNGNNA